MRVGGERDPQRPGARAGGGGLRGGGHRGPQQAVVGADRPRRATGGQRLAGSVRARADDLAAPRVRDPHPVRGRQGRRPRAGGERREHAAVVGAEPEDHVVGDDRDPHRVPIHREVGDRAVEGRDGRDPVRHRDRSSRSVRSRRSPPRRCRRRRPRTSGPAGSGSGARPPRSGGRRAPSRTRGPPRPNPLRTRCRWDCRSGSPCRPGRDGEPSRDRAGRAVEPHEPVAAVLGHPGAAAARRDAARRERERRRREDLARRDVHPGHAALIAEQHPGLLAAERDIPGLAREGDAAHDLVRARVDQPERLRRDLEPRRRPPHRRRAGGRRRPGRRRRRPPRPPAPRGHGGDPPAAGRRGSRPRSAAALASASAPQLANRSPGAFAMAVTTTASNAAETPGRVSLTSGGASCMWAYTAASSLSRVNGAWPVRHSKSMQPRE